MLREQRRCWLEKEGGCVCVLLLYRFLVIVAVNGGV